MIREDQRYGPFEFAGFCLSYFQPKDSITKVLGFFISQRTEANRIPGASFLRRQGYLYQVDKCSLTWTF